MSVNSLLLFCLLMLCSDSALSNDLVTDVDTQQRIKVRHGKQHHSLHTMSQKQTERSVSTTTPTPTNFYRDRPSLHPLVNALLETCSWSPTHKTSSGGAPVEENGCPTGEAMSALCTAMNY